MGKSEILQKVTDVCVDILGIAPDEITSDASFINDLGADSLDTLEIIMEIEKKFSISIDDEKAATIETVGQAVDAIGEIIN